MRKTFFRLRIFLTEEEGIHPIQRGKNIEDCTQLFDADILTTQTKASTLHLQSICW